MIPAFRDFFFCGGENSRTKVPIVMVHSRGCFLGSAAIGMTDDLGEASPWSEQRLDQTDDGLPGR